MKELINIFRRPFFIALPILLLLTLLLRQCWTHKAIDPYINPPSTAFDVTFEEFLVNADSLTNIYTKTGTHIEISPNSFEDSLGNQVSGIVHLLIRELHTPMEILRSGIPLRTNRIKNEFLESGGMIEIKATKDNAKLNIRPGGSMGIDLAAFKKSHDFQLFNLSDSGDWRVKDTFKVVVNERRNKILQALLSKLIPSKIEKQTDLIFELFSDLDISPQMEPLLGQKWKIKGVNVTPQVKQALRINWDSLSITKKQNGEYILEFHKEINYYDSEKKDERRHFKVRATPYNGLTKSEDKIFSFDEKLSKIDSIKKEIEAEIARVKQEAEFLNSFRIKNMGIWNIDKVAKMDQYTPVFATFDFMKELKTINKVRLFCIYEDANSVLEFTLDTKIPIYISKKSKTKIVAFLPNQKVSVVEPEILNKLNLLPDAKILLNTKIITKKKFFNSSP